MYAWSKPPRCAIRIHQSRLEEDGLGHADFNNHHKDYERYDFAHQVLSVYKLNKGLTLA